MGITLGNQSQVIDLNTGKEAATQVGSLLLTASLSTAVNAVKGLTTRETTGFNSGKFLNWHSNDWG